MLMVRLKIGQRILLLFLAVSLLPLLAVNILLLNLAQKQLKQAASNRQTLIAKQTADRVDSFLGSKVNILIFQSQTAAIRKLQSGEASLNLATMIKQDSNMERVALIDKAGMEQVVVNQSGLVTKHDDVAKSDAFKAATFLAGKEYISPVTYDGAGKPQVTIAVPLIGFADQQDLTHLSTAQFGKYRSADDIKGVLVATFSLADLWKSVLSTQVGNGGYAYVVDDKGNLIAHPDLGFLTAHQNLSSTHQVEDFLRGTRDVHESVSETGVDVLGTYEPISRTNWAVIVEEPIKSVYASINTFYRIAGSIFIVIALLVVGLSLLFRKRLLAPIKQLAAGTKRLGGGDFSQKIPEKGHDELTDLAHNFNTMGQNIRNLVANLKTQNYSLAVEQDKLSSVLSSVTDGVIAVDKNGMIILINPPAARLVAKKPDELMGTKLSHSFAWTKKGAAFPIELTKPGIYRYDEVTLQQSEQKASLDIMVSVVQHQNNDVAAILTVHDLTASRELETMKLDFVAIAAHELRTPLTVVRGYLNLINSDALKQLSVYNIENLQRALIGSEQLSSLINNLLNISRIERGQMQVVIAKVDVAILLRRAVDQQQVTAKLKSQTLEYTGPKSGVYVPADAAAISEVINNYVNNALKYTEMGSTIRLSLEIANQQVTVSVSDNGPGIPKTAQKRLFTKFYRVEHSLTSGNRGTGLGLFITKTIIDMHHGSVGMISEEGKGSTFFFRLPVYNAQNAPIKEGGKELIGKHGWIKKRPIS
jgi:signal transduction histidine kinase